MDMLLLNDVHLHQPFTSLDTFHKYPFFFVFVTLLYDDDR